MKCSAPPMVLGLTAQSLYLRLDDGFLRVSAPNLEFLTGKPLERLMDGKTVGYLGQLHFGLTACRELVPDIETLASYLVDELELLLKAADDRIPA